MNNSAIILRKFNYNYLNNNNLILIIGPSKSGKSIITKDILYNNLSINHGCVFLNSHVNIKNYNYIPPLFIHNSYDRKFIKNFVKKQLSHNIMSFLIFEDILEYKYLEKSKYLRKLLSNKINNLLCIIEIIELSKIYEVLLKKNKVDYLIITKDNYDRNRRLLFEIINIKLNIPYTLFSKFIDDYCDNYNFLILDCKNDSKNIVDKLFWYNSSIHNNFIINNKDLWNYNNLHYNNIL